MISMYGLAQFMEGFGHLDLAMVLVKERQWNFVAGEDNFLNFAVFFLLISF